MFQGRLKGVSRQFSVGFEDISGKVQRCYNGVSRKFQGVSKKVFRMLQRSFKVVSRQFQGCLKERCLKEGQWLFKGSFKAVSKKFSGNIEGCSERPLRLIQGSVKVI